MNPPSPDIISLAILNQSKANRSYNYGPDVDIMATRPFADLFHDLAMRSISDYGVPEAAFIETSSIPHLHYPCRRYHYPARPQPSRLMSIQVNVIIGNYAPDGHDAFMVMDYFALSYFCLLQQRHLAINIP